MEAGDNLSRTLTVRAEGLPATTLPPLDRSYPDAVRSYPEPEQRQSSVGQNGVVGTLTQSIALVPMAGPGGEVTLPELRIPWWDVTEDREKVAILPARTLRLAASGNPAPAPAQQVDDEQRASSDASQSSPVADGSYGIWPVIAGLLLLGWVTTAVAWWLQHRRSLSPDMAPAIADPEPDRFHRLCDQARSLDPAFFNGFPAWARAMTGRSCRTTDQALALLADDDLKVAINHWRESLFRSTGGNAPDGEQLVRLLKQARSQWQARDRNRHRGGQALPDLYPEGLSP